jgi:predicted RNA binding protein YcfA (HicA-like mRNA interferase family)
MRGTLNQRKAIELLQTNGWIRKAGGKHQVKMTKPGHRPITLPDNKRRDYPPSLTNAILKQAGLK